MFYTLRRLQPSAWALLLLALTATVLLVFLKIYKPIPANAITYIVQPTTAALLAIVAFIVSKGKSDRIRHANERAVIVGSVLAMWFVAYFSTGIFLTFVHNTLTSSVAGIMMNIIAFGVTAIGFEVLRHKILVLAGRRNVIGVGVAVAIIFTFQQINFGMLAQFETIADIVKFLVAECAPALSYSLVLTYLAISSGLASQLTFRLGIVAMMIIPPIIPKFDWYLIGVSGILVSIIVYIVIDRGQQSAQRSTIRKKTKVRQAFDITWIGAMIALVLFMTGFFAYKPMAIMSNSMQPIFSRGSMVVVQNTSNPMDINIGDIIQYQAEGKMITHRVIEITNSTDGNGDRIFITKGDNTPSRDEPVQAIHVRGIVKAYIPYIGYPSVFLKELAV